MRTDVLKHTLDYRIVRDRILRSVENRHFKLIECLARRVSEAAGEDPRVKKVYVELVKPSAMRRAESVSIIATWERRKYGN